MDGLEGPNSDGGDSCCGITFSAAVEDYLKTIYRLQTRREPTTTSGLAAELGVTPPSSSNMLKRLAAAGLVERPDSRTFVLSDHGRGHALRVIRRHRLLETFLASVLDLPWEEVHAEADVLEHVLSDRLEQRIDEVLRWPTHDPHGDPIPRADGIHDESWGFPLEEVPTGSRFRVERVSDRSSDALRWLADHGIRPGVTIMVEDRSPFDGPLWVRVDERLHALGEQLARLVHGTVLDSTDARLDRDA